MKHVIIGGDGFVGRYTARDLLALGEEVVVCDIHKSDLPIYPDAQFVHLDITDKEALASAPIEPDDVVYNMAARMLHPVMPRKQRHDYFFSVDFEGAKNVVDTMLQKDCNKLVQFSTDMVYGKILTEQPIMHDHPRNPIGEYADSKRHCENYCIEKRSEGLNVSIFRPRLIIGPGRLGILSHLFRFIKHSLPVPLIGNGSNHYQMISVFDCASSAVRAWQKNIPNSEFNLGSKNAPTVRELLNGLIREAGSRSILVSTPASLIKLTLRALDKVNLSPLVPEQFEIADEDYIVDISHTESVLDWTPKDGDFDMLLEAYKSFAKAD